MAKHDKESNLNAGLLTDAEGPDDATREAILSRLEPRVPSVVGNLADLQRAGAAVAVEPAPAKADVKADKK